MDENQSKPLSLELMETSETVYLTTVETNGFPQTRAMLNLRNKQQYPGLVDFFARHHDDFTLYFSTNSFLPKVGQIKSNPSGCAYFCIPNQWRGLMLQGYIEMVLDPDIKKALWQNGWEMYYPVGPTDPDYVVFRLKPLSAKGYHQLNHYTLKFGQAHETV